MSAVTIRPGDTVTKDPADVRVVIFDWDTENLSLGATISTSTWTITALRPSGDTALTKDQATIIPTANRKTQVRLSGGTLGAEYEIANAITTDEAPAQTKERSFRVVIENL